MRQTSQQGIPLDLTDRERVVVKEALRHYLDGHVEEYPYPVDNLEETLEEHLDMAVENGQIIVSSGMDDMYQTVFQKYAQAIKQTVPEEEQSEEMASFFEGAFKSVVGKIKDATSTPA